MIPECSATSTKRWDGLCKELRTLKISTHWHTPQATCINMCQQHPECVDIAVGKDGGSDEGRCNLYRNGCTRWEFDTDTFEFHKIYKDCSGRNL